MIGERKQRDALNVGKLAERLYGKAFADLLRLAISRVKYSELNSQKIINFWRLLSLIF